MTIEEIEPRWLRRTALVWAVIVFFGMVLPIIIIPFALWEVFHERDEVEQDFNWFRETRRDIRAIWEK